MAPHRALPDGSLSGAIAVVSGAVLVGYGVTGLIIASHDFSVAFPDGTVPGENWLGIRTNGWTNLVAMAAGLLLVGAARAHWSATRAAAAAAFGFAGFAVIALIDRRDVLGIFAADEWTALAAITMSLPLLFAASIPRSGEDLDTERQARM